MRSKSHETINCSLKNVNPNTMEYFDINYNDIMCVPSLLIKHKIDENKIELL